MADFIRFHNHERYHEGIANVAPADVYYGRREAILQRRAAQQRPTHAQRVRYNRAVRRQGTRGELAGELSVPRGLAESPRCWRRAVFPLGARLTPVLQKEARPPLSFECRPYFFCLSPVCILTDPHNPRIGRRLSAAHFGRIAVTPNASRQTGGLLRLLERGHLDPEGTRGGAPGRVLRLRSLGLGWGARFRVCS